MLTSEAKMLHIVSIISALALHQRVTFIIVSMPILALSLKQLCGYYSLIELQAGLLMNSLFNDEYFICFIILHLYMHIISTCCFMSIVMIIFFLCSFNMHCMYSSIEHFPHCFCLCIAEFLRRTF